MYQVGNNIIVFDEQGKMVVQLVDPVHIAKAKGLPQATVDVVNGNTLVMLPWHEDACSMLQNIGIDTTLAAPFWKSEHRLVEGKYKPMVHQLFTAAFMTLNPRSFILSDPRTGKTGSIIEGLDYMRRAGLIVGGALIITTVTTMPSVWAGSIQKTIPNARVAIAHGKSRASALAEPADFYVTNYDSCRIATQAFVDAVREKRIGAVVIDELTHVANASSQRHKAIDAIVNKTALKYAIGVTGSPGNNPEAVYGMCRMINRSKLPCQTKTAWMNMVTYQYGPEAFMRKPTHDAPKIIHAAMQPAVRFSKESIIDLPPITTQDRTCELSNEQKAARKSLKDEAIALLKSGEVVTSANGGVLAGKLMQVAQGFIHTNDAKAEDLEHSDRTKTIIEAVKESTRKVVIFCCYRHTIAVRKKELEDAGYTVGVVDGSITGNERAKVLDDFQNTPNPHIILAHPVATAFGTEMSAADTMIFDGPPALGGFIYTQALERLSSAKQTAPKINIIRVWATPEEQKAFASLDAGKTTGAFIANLFEQVKNGSL